MKKILLGLAAAFALSTIPAVALADDKPADGDKKEEKKAKKGKKKEKKADDGAKKEEPKKE